MTNSEFKRIAQRLADTWNFELTPGKVKVYAEGLGDLDFCAVESAVKQLALTDKYLPTIAEIREAYMVFTPKMSDEEYERMVLEPKRRMWLEDAAGQRQSDPCAEQPEGGQTQGE